MTTDSKIEWTDHTHNVWWGCARVSPGCVNCYADTFASRWGHELWRGHGPRKPMSNQYWKQPLKWNRTGTWRVFCGSMCDVFEDHPEPDVRAMQDVARGRLWDLIEGTPNLTWQLLTKRPENVLGMTPWAHSRWPTNVWIGTSVEDQRRANERIPILLTIPVAVRFLSCEPLIGPVDVSVIRTPRGIPISPLEIHYDQDTAVGQHPISWVIAGGESGRKARPCDPQWIRSLTEQCGTAGVAAFVKQLGSVWARENGWGGKGGDPDQWPHDLRIRQFPATPVPA